MLAQQQIAIQQRQPQVTPLKQPRAIIQNQVPDQLQQNQPREFKVVHCY